MTISETFLAEALNEAKSTRKMLERVPLDKSDWKPHEKSMTLGRLAHHVAELPSWINTTIESDELDFAKWEYKPVVPKTTEELLANFDEAMQKAETLLNNCSDEEMAKDWTMRNGEQVFFTMPKSAVIRTWSLNHGVHHRAQLSVYLRLLDVPVPGMYGPSADEK